ncbi:MAG: endonuclease [Chitinophagaceae bacterium]|nr:endonuclease [Chitinophagaceae bacterium]
MPEGPSILHLRNTLLPFKGKVVKQAGGYGPMPAEWINGKKLLDICTWGKHLLFVFSNGSVRVHLMLFGEIRINERKTVNRSFFLEFAKGEINGYVVKAEKLKGTPEEVYDWRTDILHKDFDAAHVKLLLKKEAGKTIDDVLMDQNVFTGVGNKIRNEALYRAGIHPLSITGKIPAAKITMLIKEAVAYVKIFYKQLETKGVNDNFSVYKQAYAADGSEVTMQILPRTKRKIYFSEHKQQLFQ